MHQNYQHEVEDQEDDMVEQQEEELQQLQQQQQSMNSNGNSSSHSRSNRHTSNQNQEEHAEEEDDDDDEEQKIANQQQQQQQLLHQQLQLLQQQQHQQQLLLLQQQQQHQQQQQQQRFGDSPILTNDSGSTRQIQRTKKLENLQANLLNSYDQKISSMLRRSSNEFNASGSQFGSTNLGGQQQLAPHGSGSKSTRNVQAIQSELQRVLSHDEIKHLARCLTEKSMANLHQRGNYHVRTGSRSSSQDVNDSRYRQNSQRGGSEYNQNRNGSLNGSYNEYLRASQSNNYMNRSTSSQSPRPLSANRAQIRLYHYSEIKKEKQELLKKLVRKQAADTANTRKISKKSSHILAEQMDRQLNHAIQAVDQMQVRHLSFEQIGRILYSLKVFQFLVYDEECHMVPSLTSQKQMDTKRKFAEMSFHEELWKVCSINNEQADVVGSNVVYCVLRILFDPVKLSTLATVELVKEYLLKYNEEHADTIRSDPDFEQQLIKLIEIWKELHIDTFAYRQIRFLKPRLVDEMCSQDEQMLTFHPKIEKTSELFELHNTINFLAHYPIDEAMAQQYMNKNRQLEYECALQQGAQNDPEGVGAGGMEGSQFLAQGSQFRTTDRYKILYKKQEIIDQKKQLQRQEKEIRESNECTFKPDLALNSRINECSMLSKYNGNFNIFDRLYNPETLEDKQLKEEMKSTMKLESELSRCTFKPSVNKTRVSGINEKIDAKDLVNDFEKNVGRIKTGYQKSMLLKEKLEHVGVGERYNELKKKRENPPSFLQREPPRKKKTVSQLQVVLNKNRVVTISLRENENPKLFAKNFAKIHQINPAMQAKLEEIITDYLSKGTIETREA